MQFCYPGWEDYKLWKIRGRNEASILFDKITKGNFQVHVDKDVIKQTIDWDGPTVTLLEAIVLLKCDLDNKINLVGNLIYESVSKKLPHYVLFMAMHNGDVDLLHCLGPTKFRYFEFETLSKYELSQEVADFLFDKHELKHLIHHSRLLDAYITCHGLDPEVRVCGCTPLEFAIKARIYDSIKILKKHGFIIDQLHDYVDDPKMIESLVAPENVNAKEDMTALSKALAKCQYKTAYVLLKNGAHLNSLRSIIDRPELVEVALQMGTGQDRQHIVLNQAIKMCQWETVEIMLQHGIYPEILHNLLQNYPLLIRCLETGKVDHLVNLKDKDDKTVLDLALARHNSHVVKTLLEHGAVVTSVHPAIQSHGLLELVLKHNPKIIDVRQDGDTAFHKALKNGLHQSALVLLDKGANYKLLDKDGKEWWEIMVLDKQFGYWYGQINRKFVDVVMGTPAAKQMIDCGKLTHRDIYEKPWFNDMIVEWAICNFEKYGRHVRIVQTGSSNGYASCYGVKWDFSWKMDSEEKIIKIRYVDGFCGMPIKLGLASAGNIIQFCPRSVRIQYENTQIEPYKIIHQVVILISLDKIHKRFHTYAWPMLGMFQGLRRMGIHLPEHLKRHVGNYLV